MRFLVIKLRFFSSHAQLPKCRHGIEGMETDGIVGLMGCSFDKVGKGKVTESINNGMILMISYKFNYIRKRKKHQRSEIQ